MTDHNELYRQNVRVEDERRVAIERADREIVRPYLLSHGIEPEDSGIEWAVRIRTIEALAEHLYGILGS